MTIGGHVIDEIRQRGPITGLDFRERMRVRDLRWWQRLYLAVTSAYVVLADLEFAGLLEGYREPREVSDGYNTRLIYRLKEDRVRA